MSPTRQLADSVQAYVRHVYGSAPRQVTMRIVLDNQDPVEFTLSGANLCTPCGADSEGLTEFDRAILDVLASLDDGKTITGEKIADKMRVGYNSRLKMALSKLVKAGLIVNNDPGYAML